MLRVAKKILFNCLYILLYYVWKFVYSIVFLLYNNFRYIIHLNRLIQTFPQCPNRLWGIHLRWFFRLSWDHIGGNRISLSQPIQSRSKAFLAVAATLWLSWNEKVNNFDNLNWVMSNWFKSGANFRFWPPAPSENFLPSHGKELADAHALTKYFLLWRGMMWSKKSSHFLT